MSCTFTEERNTEMKTWISAILFGLCLQAGAADMGSREFEDFRGQYQLADGRTLTMRSVGRRHVAEIDGIDQTVQVEVVAIDDVTFVARHGTLKLTFERWRNGNVTGVTVDGEPAPQR